MVKTKNNNSSNAVKCSPRHVVHRRASSDCQAIFKNKHIIRAPAVHSTSLAGPSQKPRSGKKMKLLPESSHRLEHQTTKRIPNPLAPVPPLMDPRRHKKLLANRVAASNYRQRKNQYVETLERRVEFEQMKVNILAPQVAYQRRQRAALMMENIALKQRLTVCEIEKAAREAKHQALKEELSRLVAVWGLMWARLKAAFNWQ